MYYGSIQIRDAVTMKEIEETHAWILTWKDPLFSGHGMAKGGNWLAMVFTDLRQAETAKQNLIRSSRLHSSYEDVKGINRLRPWANGHANNGAYVQIVTPSDRPMWYEQLG